MVLTLLGLLLMSIALMEICFFGDLLCKILGQVQDFYLNSLHLPNFQLQQIWAWHVTQAKGKWPSFSWTNSDWFRSGQKSSSQNHWDSRRFLLRLLGVRHFFPWGLKVWRFKTRFKSSHAVTTTETQLVNRAKPEEVKPKDRERKLVLVIPFGPLHQITPKNSITSRLLCLLIMSPFCLSIYPFLYWSFGTYK